MADIGFPRNRMEKDVMKLNNNLRRCRFEHGEMSQEALADAVGVSRQTIHSIEKGKFVPSTLLALKIARFFCKAVEDIFSIGDDNSSDRGGLRE